MRNRQRTFQKLFGMGKGQMAKMMSFDSSFDYNIPDFGFGPGKGFCKYFFATNNKQALENYKKSLETQLKQVNQTLNEKTKTSNS